MTQQLFHVGFEDGTEALGHLTTDAHIGVISDPDTFPYVGVQFNGGVVHLMHPRDAREFAEGLFRKALDADALFANGELGPSVAKPHIDED
jgi:hypothetical protein